jgi:flagellar hook-associated protein 1
MTDLLKLGSSNLLNVQQALATTSHNITNVNTEGYSRQTVNFAARTAQSLGFGYVGQGAYVSGIDRSVDNFLVSQVQNYSASESRYRTYLDFSSRLDNLMADANNSLNSSLKNFFNGVQEVASKPSSLPERQVMLAQANNLVQRMQSLDHSFEGLNRELNAEISSSVNEINGLTASIRQLNMQIVSASAANTGSPPNDLLDKRDLLLSELSNKIGISVVPLKDGSVNVFAGKGQALVVGNERTALATKVNPYDNTKLEVAYVDKAGGTSIISQFIDGGELHGLMDFRNRNMAQAESRAGLIALTLSAEFNAAHEKGMDLQSNMGAKFFNTATIAITAHQGNTGTAAPSLAVTDTGQIRASEYQAKYDGANWHLIRMNDGTSVTGTGTLSLDGMQVNLSAGTPVLGDSFSFNPGRDAANNFQVLIKDPQQIAAASAVKISTASVNAGKGVLPKVEVTDASLMPLTTPLQIRFDADALGVGIPGFVLSGAATGTLAYDPVTESEGKTFTLAALGLRFQMTGSPATNDQFTLGSNVGGRGDNRNALALAGLQQGKLLNGRADTLQDFYGTLVADVGTNQQQAEANHDIETSLLSQARQYRDSVSGVNLDEEAANLLRFQQAYQAAAQMIKIADEVFNALLAAVR